MRAMLVSMFAALLAAGCNCGGSSTPDDPLDTNQTPNDGGGGGGGGGTGGGGGGGWTTDTGDAGVLTFPTDPPPVYADAGLAIPLYLPNGRTYDQQKDYIAWSGPVSKVTLTHRDQTSLPPSEGGDFCGDDCTEEVTRIGAGGSVSGHFIGMESFSVQVASEDGAGTATIEACGQVIMTASLQASTPTPGFNNYPSPAWQVPTADRCDWKVSASGGFVDFRAVTAKLRPGISPPAVDVKIDGLDAPPGKVEPGTFTLSWTSEGYCLASGKWTGTPPASGSYAFSALPPGTYQYTLTCTNQMGTSSDTVAITIAPIG